MLSACRLLQRLLLHLFTQLVPIYTTGLSLAITFQGKIPVTSSPDTRNTASQCLIPLSHCSPGLLVPLLASHLSPCISCQIICLYLAPIYSISEHRDYGCLFVITSHCLTHKLGLRKYFTNESENWFFFFSHSRSERHSLSRERRLQNGTFLFISEKYLGKKLQNNL